jgi:hypothetical protein
MTVGAAVSNRQPSVSPACGDMTASISAAVVPGAKLLAITVYGPPVATPRMLKPAPSLLRAGGFALRLRTDANLSYVRLLRSTCDAEAVRLGAGPRALAAGPLGLFSLCRSCCHYPSMIPAGFADDERFCTPALPLMRLSNVGFSEVCRGFAPAPAPAPGALALRPRPRNCCARSSFFLRSR